MSDFETYGDLLGQIPNVEVYLDDKLIGTEVQVEGYTKRLSGGQCTMQVSERDGGRSYVIDGENVMNIALHRFSYKKVSAVTLVIDTSRDTRRIGGFASLLRGWSIWVIGEAESPLLCGAQLEDCTIVAEDYSAFDACWMENCDISIVTSAGGNNHICENCTVRGRDGNIK